MALDALSVILFHVILIFSIVSAEHSLSLVAEMGDTLEFNDIYQEVKGSWVSMFFSPYIHCLCLYKNHTNLIHLNPP